MQYQGWGGQQGYGGWDGSAGMGSAGMGAASMGMNMGMGMGMGVYDQGQQHPFIGGDVSAGMGMNIAAYGQGGQEQQVLLPNTVVRILYDYVATERGVLSLRAGDVATLLEFKDQGWCILKTTAGQEGYFPQSYIEPAGAIAAVGAPAVPTNVQVRCEVHNKNRSAANLMQEPNPLTNGVTMRWVCKPGCECKGAAAVGPPSAAQQAANQATHASMLLAAQAAAAEYMAKHAGGQKPADGGSAWALPGYMTAGAAAALSSGRPLTASGLTPEQLKAAAEATAVALAGKEVEAKKLLIPSAKVIGRMIVLAPFENKDGAPNTITSLKAGDQVDLIKEDDKGWTMIKTREGLQGYYPSAFLKVKEGTTIKKETEAAANQGSNANPSNEAKASAGEQERAQKDGDGVNESLNGGGKAKGGDAELPGGVSKDTDSSDAQGEGAEGASDAAAAGTKRPREESEGQAEDGESPAKAPCA